MKKSTKQRIVITGSQGTGKTTLIEKLAQYVDLPVIKETSRSVARILNIPENGHLPLHQRLEWQRGILWWQITLENTYESFISDRSLIDHWAYSRYWLGENIKLLNTFYKIVLKQAQTYTHIIYLPPILPLQEDGFRSIDQQYLNTIDQIIREIIDEWYGHNSKKVKIIKDNRLDIRIKESLDYMYYPQE